MKDQEPFTFTDAEQGAIYQGLLLISENSAAFFKDAARLMEGSSPMETRAHLVGHCLREVECGVRQALRSVTDEPFTEVKCAVCGSPTGRRCESCGNFRKESRAQEIEAIGRTLELDPVVIRAWQRQRLDKFAHRRGLHPPREVNTDLRRAWEDIQTVLVPAINGFRSRYGTVYERAEALAARTDYSRAVDEFSSSIPQNRIVVNHFFDKLEDPGWLAPLRGKGYFERPYPVEVTEGGVTHVPWAPSRYLARMADRVPQEVHRTMMSIPETGNYWTHRDLAEAACSLPGDLATDWATKEASWIRRQDSLGILPASYGSLAAHLVEHGNLDVAREFSAALLAPAGDEGKFRLDDYEYGEIVHAVLEPLLKRDRPRALSFFCDLLEGALEVRGFAGMRLGKDSSVHWRPAIEEHQQNVSSDQVGTLLVTVRDAAEHILTTDPTEGAAALEALKAREATIFRRIALHALRKASGYVAAVEQLLTTPGMATTTEFHREFWLLARDRFGEVSEETRQALLRCIKDGLPSIDEDRLQDAWRLRCLTILRDVLPEEWSNRLQELEACYGKHAWPEFWSHHESGTAGTQSPKQVAELQAMDDDELLEYLKTWKPSGSPFEPVPEGLGRELTHAVQDNLLRFASLAPRFVDQEPTYVRAFLEGVAAAQKAGKEFDWDPVLTLGSWVAEQSPGDPIEWNAHEQRDSTWGQAHQILLDLLGGCLGEDCKNPIPISERERVWRIISTLATAEQRGEAQEYEQVSAGDSSRSRALLKALAYAHWVGRETGSDSKERHWLDEVKEVGDLLASCLEDRSPETRAFYGRWLPNLFWLDGPWLQRHLDQVFPEPAKDEPGWATCWDAFVVFNVPYGGEVLALVLPQYRRAVARLPSTRQGTHQEWAPDRNLVEHIMLLYVHGDLGLEEGDLVAEFFRRAPPDLRAYAIEHQGRCIWENDGPLAPEMLERVKALLDWRLKCAREASDGTEFRRCGWWFGPDKLETGWAVERLNQMLSLGEVEPEHVVLEFLERAAVEHHESVARCLRLMVDGTEDAWRLAAREKQVRSIVAALKASDNKDARKLADEAVHRLVARGLVGFKDLLGNPA